MFSSSRMYLDARPDRSAKLNGLVEPALVHKRHGKLGEEAPAARESREDPHAHCAALTALSAVPLPPRATRVRILAGLVFDDEGKLDHVVFTSTISNEERPALTRQLEGRPPGFTGKAPGGPSRWSTERSWTWEPVRPELVVEVRYDHVTGDAFDTVRSCCAGVPTKHRAQCTLEHGRRIRSRRGQAICGPQVLWQACRRNVLSYNIEINQIGERVVRRRVSSMRPMSWRSGEAPLACRRRRSRVAGAVCSPLV